MRFAQEESSVEWSLNGDKIIIDPMVINSVSLKNGHLIEVVSQGGFTPVFLPETSFICYVCG